MSELNAPPFARQVEGVMISRSLRDRHNKCEISQFTIYVQTREAAETVDDLHVSQAKNRRR